MGNKERVIQQAAIRKKNDAQDEYFRQCQKETVDYF